MSHINRTNFHHCTIGLFTSCEAPKRAPDYTSYTPWGDVSSVYWFTEDGVIRQSDHWGRVASCRWNLYGLNEGHPAGSPCVKCPTATGFVTFAQLSQNDLLREALIEAVVSGDDQRAAELRTLFTF